MAKDLSYFYTALGLDDRETLGRWISGIRSSLKLNRDEFSGFIYRNPFTVGKWERGQTRPPYPDLKMLEALAANLVGAGKLSPEYLDLYKLAEVEILDASQIDQIINYLKRFSSEKKNSRYADIKPGSNDNRSRRTG